MNDVAPVSSLRPANREAPQTRPLSKLEGFPDFRRRRLSAGAWIAILALIGCTPAFVGTVASANPTLEESTEEYYPVQPDATISVKNRDGAIRIYGAETDEAKVQTIKRAYSADRLKGITVKVSSKPGALALETLIPAKSKGWFAFDRSGTVEYNIVVPQTCKVSNLELTDGEVVVQGMRGPGVKASLGNGRLAGHNCFGDLRFSVANGGLDLFYDWWENRRMALNLRTDNGGVRAILPSDAAFSLDAQTQNGHIVNAFLPKEPKPSGAVNMLTEVVGVDPRAQLTIRTNNGNIRIDEAY